MRPSRSMQRIDLCGQPFKGLRERGMYYVDKSLLIKELLDSNDRGVFLFTRPRRFEKTTNLSMLDAFFNIRYAGNPWFDDLEISRYPEYTGYKNRFPVIHLNLNDTKANTYESYINKLRIAVKDAYEPHRYLLEDDDLDTAVRDNFDSFARRNISEDFLSTSIKDLSDAISRNNRRPIILIDEYDRAVTDNFGKKSQKDILDFLGDFLCSALKTNANREMAYMTGIMQIAQTGSFSGLNNVSVHNIWSWVTSESVSPIGRRVGLRPPRFTARSRSRASRGQDEWNRRGAPRILNDTGFPTPFPEPDVHLSMHRALQWTLETNEFSRMELSVAFFAQD